MLFSISQSQVIFLIGSVCTTCLTSYVPSQTSEPKVQLVAPIVLAIWFKTSIETTHPTSNNYSNMWKIANHKNIMKKMKLELNLPSSWGSLEAANVCVKKQLKTRTDTGNRYLGTVISGNPNNNKNFTLQSSLKALLSSRDFWANLTSGTFSYLQLYVSLLSSFII